MGVLLHAAEYGVLLAPAPGTGGDDEARRFEAVLAVSRDRAADMAENSNPGWTAVEVTARWNVAGRCRRCGIVAFHDERPVPVAVGVQCRDC